MSTTQPIVERAMFPLVPRMTTVVEITQLTPKMRRFVLQGEDLRSFESRDADDHMKLVFPAEGQAEPVLPQVTDQGLKLPDGAVPPQRRDFTPRLFDAATGTLTVDFYLHGSGPAGNWAESATIGSKLGVLGPRGSKVVTGGVDVYLLVGDETALPSIARRLEELPAGQKAIAIVEVDNPAEEQEIETKADVQLTWLHRNGAAPGTTNLLEDAIRALPKPEGTVYTLVGGEATSLRPIRAYMKEAGYDPALTSFSGHWKRGVSDHDHHEEV
ncbi:MAG: siderophore-interacting protein [Thermomicrobiales bacterium]|nr:siderophore-interacting protein [Thermomicrobiales bacterium]MCO5221428.1 siderophore-interacting protein [Thermomicrobiales bacterium]